ncbi:uncharacterized protein LOC126841437 [Adelges cooleyi]|uniref:uncharacterized protein LOC126841437 n=1 Tax=Adelges cooleyi TaxID=133065 RepID=UPI00217FCA98|nr:uncharacterized protein LOC126841437 [Adelges cooleyi]
MTIVCGYNLPMVKLNGDSTFTAPTTYVLMESYGGTTLTTPSVVQKINPIWNSEWTILLPKHLLIEEKWLILELWCKKFQNEYAGHDPKRDLRLGFIFLDLSSLKYDLKHAGGLYDVISETEEYHGKIKVIIDPLNCSNIQKQSSLTSNNQLNIINRNKSSVNSNSETIFKRTNKPEDLAKLKSVKSSITSTKSSKEKYCDHIDLTGPDIDETTKMFSGISLKKKAFEYKKKCDSSSITSWTSSSDDIILCSENPQFQLMNAYLNNGMKLNQIK